MTVLRVYVVGLVVMLHQALRVLWASWRRSPQLGRVCGEAPRRWSLAVLRAARVRVVVEGLDQLAQDSPAVLVANHESWFDVFALAGYLPVEYRFVAKQELGRIPIFGASWKACGHISLDRSDRASAIQTLEAARERIRREGGVVVMFPEGTRTTGAEMLPFKKGAFVLALQLGVPVIPVGISGSRKIMPKGSWRIRPGTIRVRIGAPLSVEGMSEEHRGVLLARARSAVAELRKPLVGGTGPSTTGAEPVHDPST